MRQSEHWPPSFTHEVNTGWGKAEGMNTDVTIYTTRGAFQYFYTEVGVLPRDATFEELTAKLKSCARHAYYPRSTETLKQLADTIYNLEKLTTLSPFTAQL